MRITTKMVNDAAEKAGIPINSNSLLDYVKGNGSNDNLLSALQENDSKTSTKSKSRYEKLEKAAEELAQKAEALTAQGEDSLFAKAKESGNTEEIRKKAEDLVKSYNETLRTLQSSTDALDEYYGRMLREAAEQNSAALGAIGISVGKDGALSVDSAKLKAAGIDSLEAVLAQAGSFAGKTAFLAERIADNAKANAESLSSYYQADGNAYTASSSKYDFLG